LVKLEFVWTAAIRKVRVNNQYHCFEGMCVKWDKTEVDYMWHVKKNKNKEKGYGVIQQNLLVTESKES
jgi:hypothetical protein